MLSYSDIKKIIPHRFPILLLDEVSEIEINKYAIGKKAISATDSFISGHFPNYPIMPGVLIIEAMAQLSCVLAAHSKNKNYYDDPVYLLSIEKAKFRKEVKPPSILILKTELTKEKGRFWQLHCTAFVNEVLAAEADIMATM